MTLALTTTLLPLAALALIPGDTGADDAPSLSLDSPVRLQLIGGEPIDVGQYGGYAAPVVYHVDDDGTFELLVGTFTGKIAVFDVAEGACESRGLLHAGGAAVDLHNW